MSNVIRVVPCQLTVPLTCHLLYYYCPWTLYLLCLRWHFMTKSVWLQCSKFSNFAKMIHNSFWNVCSVIFAPNLAVEFFNRIWPKICANLTIATADALWVQNCGKVQNYIFLITISEFNIYLFFKMGGGAVICEER